ncbi:MAG TPA: hypothetical protein DD670_04025 [Planctomycetaceae bacterium]|nr:hypothetical protein [Planctomycetaceae bacterium]
MWILLIIAVFVCGLSLSIGIRSTIRIAAVTGYIVLIAAQLRHPGPKLRGVVSVACAAAFNVLPFLADFVVVSGQRLSPAAETVAEVVALVIFLMWILFALLAIRHAQHPNRTLGWLSLLLVLSPGILDHLDHFQYRACSLLRIEWWHFRPFAWLMDVLWFT